MCLTFSQQLTVKLSLSHRVVYSAAARPAGCPVRFVNTCRGPFQRAALTNRGQPWTLLSTRALIKGMPML